ncbi:DUF6118 family protein [Asticcacaulis excentricus]|uniref:Uncharacterized protein n=1 Tax=Asticcacaulis excentricus (strain ATCC 15261 / DSM 4724 / KCTC 12464 / NCIMB 9791 / VKM B-1370 / CB 48) TaxID=573065 RepID=E8RPW4_ASTEC|nr:DUF6118 family protein [Asticcacaulis excentricus]ADU13137.1 hypothetical protein Astex_1471 [Asticcacaulis excentricus CB 48]
MVDETRPKGADRDEAEAATKAFDGLRNAVDKRGAATAAELKLIRQGVEALFDQVEVIQAKPDYAQDLAEIKEVCVDIADRLETIEAMPALKGGVQDFERAGSDLLRSSVTALEQKAQRFDSAAVTLQRIASHVQDRQEWWRYLFIAGGLGLVAGVLLVLFILGLLPLEVRTNVAAALVGTGRWEAGAVLMQAERPEAWAEIVQGEKLREQNRKALGRCRELARKRGVAQKCNIVVEPDIPR